MPFSRYLQSNERDQQPSKPDDDLDHAAFSTNVHFQLPNLIFNAPTVPPGGGAEALPAGLYPPPSSSLAWFANPQHQFPTNPCVFPPVSLARPYRPRSAASLHHNPYLSSSTPSSSSSPQSATAPAFPLLPQPNGYPSQASPSSLLPFPSHLPLSIPSALGLPIYSASGFDLLSLLARVVTRPYPKIYLGPVDLSCSFVVTDARRFDAPIGISLAFLAADPLSSPSVPSLRVPLFPQAHRI